MATLLGGHFELFLLEIGVIFKPPNIKNGLAVADLPIAF